MKKRILSVGAAALVLGLVVAPAAAAFTSPWHTATYGSYYVSGCGPFEHGRSSSTAYIQTGSCVWPVAIRVQYNEFGTNYTSGWSWGTQIATITRDRMSAHQFQY